jgi:hypothetical protein
MSKLLEIAPVENKSDHPDENVVNAAGANTTATVIAKTKKKKTTTCANCGNLGHYTPKCPLKVKTVTSTGPEEMHEIREIDDFKKLLVEERKINQDEIDLLARKKIHENGLEMVIEELKKIKTRKVEHKERVKKAYTELGSSILNQTEPENKEKEEPVNSPYLNSDSQ